MAFFRKFYDIILPFATVFFAGFVAMAIELCLAKMLAPYFGTSMVTWSVLIAIVLAFFALGYYLGGIVADMGAPHKHLYTILLATATLVFVIPVVSVQVLEFFSQISLDYGFSLYLITLGMAIAILSVPIILLAMIPPIVVRMVQTGSLSQLGANVGKVYAVSTLGSITGVLFPTLVLMPTIGVRKSFVLLSLFIFMCAVLGLERKRFALLILLPVFGFFVIPPHLKILPYQVYSAESMYNFIYVVDDGRRISLLFDEGLYFQSSQYKGRIISGSAHNAFNLMPLLVSGRDALLMGLGGGTVVKQYRAYFNMNVDVVEIDGKVLDVARQYFDLPEKGVNVHIMDARRYLLGAKKRYDVIGMDVFISEQVQEHLTTTEFFELLKKRLKPDGVLGINVVTVSAESSLMRHLYASLKEHFNYVRVFRSGPYNFFVLATDGSNVDELKRRVDGLSDSMLKASLQATLSRPVKVNRATQPAYDDVLYNFDYEQIQIRWNMLRASETCMLYTQSSQPTP